VNNSNHVMFVKATSVSVSPLFGFKL